FPRCALAWNNLGLYQDRIGLKDEALRSYNEAAVADPRYAKAFLNIGAALWDRGDWSTAEDNWVKAVKLDPRLFVARQNLAFALLRRKQFASAIVQLKALEEENVQSAEIHELMAIGFQGLGDTDAANLERQKAYSIRSSLLTVRSSDKQ